MEIQSALHTPFLKLKRVRSGLFPTKTIRNHVSLLLLLNRF